MDNTLLEIHKSSIGVSGFWDEGYKATLIKAYESFYKTEIIRDWCISDIVLNGDKVLVKWVPRFRSLTDEELLDKYGRSS